jgi:hypothetical protein
MFRKNRFKIGTRVNAISLTGKRILGEYRGVRGSYGVYVYGLAVGCFTPELHVCRALTLEKVLPPTDYTKRTPPKFKLGDKCLGLDISHREVRGEYIQSEGKYAWIKGHYTALAIQERPSAIKVLTTTLQKL